MTPRQLWFHLTLLGVSIVTLLGALGAAIFVVPQLGWEAQHFAWLALAWQTGLVLVIAGAGIFNMRWGFLTARPMWLLIVTSALTGWLIPLAVWAFRIWCDECLYLEAERARMRAGTTGRKKGDSASKDCPAP